jgi:uncharacterized membrane protein
MKDLLLTGLLFCICGAFGYLMGIMTERKQTYKRRQDNRPEFLRTYTNTKTSVKYTYGDGDNV